MILPLRSEDTDVRDTDVRDTDVSDTDVSDKLYEYNALIVDIIKLLLEWEHA